MRTIELSEDEFRIVLDALRAHWNVVAQPSDYSRPGIESMSLDAATLLLLYQRLTKSDAN